MRLLLVLSLFVFASCSSTQKVADNLYMASCDGMFGGCVAEMEEACPGGYKILAKKTEWLQREMRQHIHFQCTEVVGSTR